MNDLETISLSINQEGFKLILQSIRSHINRINEWNFGDDYDSDLTQHHVLLAMLIKKYSERWSDADDENYSV